MPSLRAQAIHAINSCTLDDKIELTRQTAKAWFDRKLSLRSPSDPELPARPGRPDRPVLVPPRQVKHRGFVSRQARFSLLHALAHIELNAVDLALDIVARFAAQNIPRSFFDGWMQVANEEARHFALVRGRLAALGGDYGDLPAHDGLWEAAHDTRDDLTARLAVVPLILEARGLDVTPSLQEKLREADDHESADVLATIYEDEKGHVAVGAKWFRFLCARHGQNPQTEFQRLVREKFHRSLKAPFNDMARADAGLTPSFYRNLSPKSQS
jgi:uncharacterized ferritin-like protein (DUF455 family)